MRSLPFADPQVVRSTYIELVQSVFETLIPTIITGVLFILVSSLCVVRMHDSFLVGLAVAGSIASLARVSIILTCKNRSGWDALNVESAERFEKLFGSSYVAFAAILGAFASRIVLVGTVDLHLIVTALIVGYAAGVAAGVSIRPRISLTAITCSVGPLGVACVWRGEIIHMTLALVLTALAAGGIKSMWTRYKWTADTIAVRHLLDSLARKDPLTGLANRLGLAQSYKQFREDADQALALHCLDLDRFKPVNDLYGHPVGDQLLQMVGLRLQEVASEQGLAVRLGGDEFALLQGRISHPEQVDLMSQRVVRALSEPYVINGTRIVVGVSVGSAITSDAATTLGSLMEAADEALYRVKNFRGFLKSVA